MDVTELPFNRMIGLESVSPEHGVLASLPPGPQYTNHLGTVHASALFALAEAASGVFLIQQFGSAPMETGPVVRRAEAKFRRPALGRVRARATVVPDEIARWKSELVARGRLSAAVTIEVIDDTGNVVLDAVLEWFIPRKLAEI
jgi:acyl-coenzyme A thioesterase PaaI-like protein